ncbi:MAG: ATP-dependent zinc metalloprotease FtsH [Lactobacillales bacterium]|jgi:cell division protease FtsH|nr:ATP-dependent zinc metalloprotease FtsH [Lactobacillales bacterium]
MAQQKPTKKPQSPLRTSLYYVFSIIGMVLVVFFLTQGSGSGASNAAKDSETAVKKINYSTFVQYAEKGEVKSYALQPATDGVTVEITGELTKTVTVKGETTGLFGKKTNAKTKKFSTLALVNDSPAIQKIAQDYHIKKYSVKKESNSNMWFNILIYVGPTILFIVFFFMMFSGAKGGGGGNPMSFAKAKTKQQDDSAKKVRFEEVAGADEEKQELVEIVEFLKSPDKFTKLGARIPAGVLLEGPPGTGKTLLAKAVAGEAGVPFYSMSGSDFMEMFVGVGASRVRDLFEKAKKTAPSIIFIDEIDAIGRKRGSGMGGGHDEREQTLNQLLVEMDGFAGNEGVIVMAATNRVDVLDPALLRAGRFDRQILVGRPDVKGREAILRVHSKNKPLAQDIDLKAVAKQTPGYVGADLENVLNEAALIAARRNKEAIDASDMDEAQDRVIAGPAKKNRAMSERERKMVAFHEAGHTIIGLVLDNANTVHKVTIVPRGRAGGYMLALPKEDQFLITKTDMIEQIVSLLGGRVAEEIVFNVQSTGASNDFMKASQIARSMVTEYGMSDKIGPVQYEGQHGVFVGQGYQQQKAFSENVSYEIDMEVRRILNEAHFKAREIIEANRDKHTLIAEKLLELETLDERTIKALWETGEMPAEFVADEDGVEAPLSFEEAKNLLDKGYEAKPEEPVEEQNI